MNLCRPNWLCSLKPNRAILSLGKQNHYSALKEQKPLVSSSINDYNKGPKQKVQMNHSLKKNTMSYYAALYKKINMHRDSDAKKAIIVVIQISGPLFFNLVNSVLVTVNFRFSAVLLCPYMYLLDIPRYWCSSMLQTVLNNGPNVL